MPYRILTIAFDPSTGSFADQAIDEFCLTRKVISLKSEFFINNEQWEGE